MHEQHEGKEEMEYSVYEGGLENRGLWSLDWTWEWKVEYKRTSDIERQERET